MLQATARRRTFRTIRWAAVAALTSGSAACGGGHDAPPPVPITAPPSSYAVHAVAVKDGVSTPLSFGPLTAGYWSKGSAATPTTSAESLHVQALRTKAPMNPNGLPNGVANPAWSLLWGAAAECGMGAGANSPTQVQGHFKPNQTPVIPAWSTEGAYYIFPHGPLSCDETLEDEETLLCIADKLAEVADNVGTVEWKNPETTSPPAILGALPPGKWVFGPQATADKFVARDLAIQVLGQVARLSSDTQAGLSCARHYARAANPTYATENSGLVFYVPTDGLTTPSYPPSSIVVGSDRSADLANDRLAFEAHVLRASARLLHDLVESSIDSDLAGIEAARNGELDPTKGNQIAWGDRPGTDAAFNSMQHLTRVLAGRWEADPATTGCGSSNAASLGATFGSDYDARTTDIAPTTTSQLTAIQIAEQVGVVMPASALVAATDASLKSALKQAVIAKRGRENSTSLPSADSTNQLIDQLSDADVRFAFERNLRTLRLLTNQGPEIALASLATFGLTTHPDFSGGVTVDGGLDRARLKTDPMARSAGLWASSQCQEPGGVDALMSADNPYTSDTTLPIEQRYQRSILQDPSSMGQAFLRRLAVIREEIGGSTDAAGSLASAETVAQGAMTEASAWAGPGQIVTVTHGKSVPQDLELRLAGIEPTSIGLAPSDSTDSGLSTSSALGIAYGPAWVAECATKARTDCPVNFEATYTRPLNATLAPPSVAERRTRGITHYSGTGTVHVGDLPGVAAGPSADSQFYVFTKTGTSGKTAGRVIGVISVAPGEGKTVFTPLPIAGIGVAIDTITPTYKPPSLDGSSLAEPPTYCAGNVPRDIFVPLENELTSDSDGYENSWRHYLNLAKTAAQRADELGAQLVAQGTQLEFRREAAAEQTAEICGGPTNLTNVHFSDDGMIEASKGDVVLNTCLSEPSKDLVFLGSDPLASTSDATGRYLLARSILGCSSASDPAGTIPGTGPGAGNALCRKPAGYEFTHASLDIADTPTPPRTDDRTRCDDIVNIFKSVDTGFNSKAFTTALGMPALDPAALSGAMGALKLHVDAAGDFRLVAGATIVMSSFPADAAAGAWPICWTADTCALDTNPMNRVFETTLRACHDHTLGYCEIDVADKPSAEINAIRWRLENALWQLGAITGSVPPNTFDMYVPAANFASTSWPASPTANIATTYLPGTPGLQGSTFELVSGALRLKDALPSDAREVGDAVPIDARYGQLGYAFIANELDPLQKDIYSHPDRYVHLQVKNNGWQPDYGILLHQLDDAYGTAHFADDLSWHHSMPPDFLSLVGTGIAGATCGWTSRNATGAAWGSAAESRLQFLEVQDYADRVAGPAPALDGHITWQPDGTYLTKDYFTFPFLPFPRKPQWAMVAGSAGLSVFAGPSDFIDGLRPAGVNKPSDRVRLFVNPATDASCSTVRKLTQSLALGCAVAFTGTTVAGSPPRPGLDRLEDLAQFEAWIGGIANSARSQLAQLYVTSMPTRVVADFQAKTVGTGSTKGSHGDRILELEAELNNLASAWRQVAGDLDQLRTALRATRLQIEAADIKGDEDMVRLTLQQYQIYAEMAKSTVEAIKTFGAGAGVLAFEGYEAKLVGDLKSLSGSEKAKTIASILNNLASSSSSYWSDLDKSLNAVRSSTARSHELVDQLSRSESKATYEAAKGAGADYVSIDGSIVTLPTNAVLRRTYDVTALRYKNALTQAKYLTYLARRAIEQRIGLPLNKLASPLGALPAPAEWVDKLCGLTGIDYQKLKSNLGPAAPISDDKVITTFADQYIGDYVTKLEELIEYYNVAFPSHDGDDIAVLSLREDLLAGTSACATDAPNLLYHSGQLDVAPTGSSGPSGPLTFPLGGWRVHPCGATKCLKTLPRLTLAGVLDAPPGLHGDCTWLHEEAPSASPATVPADLATAPTGMVSQAVHLEPGRYVVSWWDQARSDAGKAVASSSDYDLAVYDSTWASLPGSDFKGQGHDGTTTPWGERRSLTFEVKVTGTYYVGINAGVTSSPTGNVAIGNVQLEQLLSTDTGPTPYVATDATRAVASPLCKTHSSVDLRAAFVRKCDGSGACFYELSEPLVLNTIDLANPASPLRAKLAAGNFNYRHVGVSLNLVGTGVRDCGTTPTPSCYGSGFQEFSLVHDAHDVQILTWHKDRYSFDFGRGHIEHAKALAAERYLTVPFGSTDLGLLTQPGIEKAEFRGRPLDGSYQLRIWDSPSLHWSKLDDVQLVLKYHYWSVVDRSDTP